MRRVAPHRQYCQVLCMAVLGVLACGFLIAAHAGLRGPGKYCGVVVFDRWDTYFLLSGPYITYISDSVKNELRQYEGRAMQVDASEVFQPRNPGDALIRKFKISGSAPDTHHWATLDGLELTTESDFGPRGTPTFVIEIRNRGNRPVEINSSEIGPALLRSSQKSTLSASDGRSVACITRGNLVSPSSWERTIDGVKTSASYTIDPKSRPPERLKLEPGRAMKARVTFKVPPGQYQFMVGYGGGVHEEKSLASNAISFDLSAGGIATLTR